MKPLFAILKHCASWVKPTSNMCEYKITKYRSLWTWETFETQITLS